ncbi:MAG: hypothetical protein NWQ85_06160 [Schleiferiaceae bacterium]|nr:hypothetical protein [Schleiferiaceae bacterium]MDP4932916.1 hypothetical protein [Schleiferiaceae bacterium]
MDWGLAWLKSFFNKKIEAAKVRRRWGWAGMRTDDWARLYWWEFGIKETRHRCAMCGFFME